MPTRRRAVFGFCLFLFPFSFVLVRTPLLAIEPLILHSVGGIPAHLAGLFLEPANFQRGPAGEYFIFDRRAHTVFIVDAGKSGARKVVQIGHEEGRIIEPGAFDLEPGGNTFVVADAPGGRERIQLFGPAGLRIGGFSLPGRAAKRLVMGGLVLNGVGSLQYTGRTILINQPETGALVTEYSLTGAALRTFGSLRRTGHEKDHDVHMALNSGMPLVNPKGGFYFVFQAGEPVFRKYDRDGQLTFERSVQGREVDPILNTIPTTWPRKRGAPDAELPLVTPTVRTAAVAPDGVLWIALAGITTYVYDGDGDKIRSVQLHAAGPIAPTSLFFTNDGRLLATPGLYEFEVGP
jgi:hypothetical protein